ncbi:hypothetical protein D3C80_1700710 [compost metagenome]
MQRVDFVGLYHQLLTVDQIARHRAAQQAAGNHAEGGRRQRRRGCPDRTEVFGDRPERGGRTKAPFQRHGTGHDPQQWVNAQRLGHADAHQVLQQGQAPAGTQVDEQDLATLAQQAQAATETDSSEKCHHQRRLHGGIEFDIQ